MAGYATETRQFSWRGRSSNPAEQDSGSEGLLSSGIELSEGGFVEAAAAERMGTPSSRQSRDYRLLVFPFLLPAGGAGIMGHDDPDPAYPRIVPQSSQSHSLRAVHRGLRVHGRCGLYTPVSSQ